MTEDQRTNALGAIARMMLRNDLTIQDVAEQLARPGADQRDTNRKRVADMVCRPGGANVKEMMAANCGDSPNAVGHSVLVIEARGLAFRGKRTGERLRWFGTASEAREWEAAQKSGNGAFTTTRKERPAPVPRVKATPIVKAAKVLAKPLGPAELTGYQPPLVKATKLRGDVDMSRAKVTICPSAGHDPRYQVEPGTRVLGGFATAGIGRYMEGVAA